MSVTNKDLQYKPYDTVIKVLGSGGAGNNTISHLMGLNRTDIETISLNTDAQNLLKIDANRKVLIGKSLTNGLGAGGDPEIGEKAAEESIGNIKPLIKGTDLLFLTAGMGGGTGTGSLPVVSQLAKEMGILTIAIVTMPFSDEGIIRWENAQIGLDKLRKNVDTLIILRNDKLVDLYPDLPLSEAFQQCDDILISSLLGITDLVQNQGLVNLDFADISMVMRDGPDAVIGIGQSNSDTRSEEAVKRAIGHPMMDTDISGAQSALVHVAGGSDMTLKEARQVIHSISSRLDPNARIIWGSSVDENLTHSLKVTLIISGLQPKRNKNKAGETDQQNENPVVENNFTPNELDHKPVYEESGPEIFDIKESILNTGMQVSTKKKSPANITQSSLVFYKIFEDEAAGDLKRFDRSLHFLRRNPDNRKSLLDARQSCKLLLASAQMFGFDEIAQLLQSIDELLAGVQSRELKLTPVVIDSITLAMEMVVDLIENRSDGRGETGYIVHRLKEIKAEDHKTVK